MKGVDPEGLFDYSKGRFTAFTVSGKSFLVIHTVHLSLTSKLHSQVLPFHKSVVIAISGFGKTGQGRMVGPSR